MVEGGKLNPERLVMKKRQVPCSDTKTVKNEHRIKIRNIANQINQGLDITKKEEIPAKQPNLPEKINEAL